MKVNWIIGQETKTTITDSEMMKNIAPIWGSHTTWKQYKTDNSICNDITKAKDLIGKAFHAITNLYVPEDDFVELGRPVGLKLFGGQFKQTDFQYKDDIVALWLASVDADIVLLLGFDLSESLDSIARKGYYQGIMHVITENSTTQYVLVDYNMDISTIFDGLDNLTQDSLEAVKQLLI